MNEFTKLCEQLASRLRAAGAAEDVDPAVPEAAVALILRQNLDEAELLVIRRAVSERDHWSGHLALPGGRKQPDDASLLATAMREACEEVGLDLAAGGRALGVLERVEPRSHGAPVISVTPFVFVAPAAFHVSKAAAQPLALATNAEVAAAFWIALSSLAASGRSITRRGKVAGEERDWPAYPTPEGPIWGLTERVITALLAMLDAR